MYADLWHANKKRKDEAHAKQQPPVGAAANEQEGSIDNFSGCAERESGFIAANGHDGDTSADRPTSMNAQVRLATPYEQPSSTQQFIGITVKRRKYGQYMLMPLACNVRGHLSCA